MAGRGPLPKDPSQRKRRNKPPEMLQLPTATEAKRNKVPALPKLSGKTKWHPQVVEWWESIWKSPMAARWLDSDVKGGLYLLAMMQQDFWMAESISMRMSVLGQIRMQEPRFGLTPLDRSRLRWEVPKEGDNGAPARSENAPSSTRRPWEVDDPEEPGGDQPVGTDPRSTLFEVSDGGQARKKKGA